ncbi:MAG TPA: PrsW family intramembrane metalloprotease, partial [Methanofastidiosum sp.]|nr:PrsW family intramembrane metalloprotease [Methanofastidiosum sp.]
MDAMTLLSIALAPGIFWVWFFYKKDKYEPEPKKIIIFTFLLGVLATIPAGLINSMFVPESLENAG